VDWLEDTRSGFHHLGCRTRLRMTAAAGMSIVQHRFAKRLQGNRNTAVRTAAMRVLGEALAKTRLTQRTAQAMATANALDVQLAAHKAVGLGSQDSNAAGQTFTGSQDTSIVDKTSAASPLPDA